MATAVIVTQPTMPPDSAEEMHEELREEIVNTCCGDIDKMNVPDALADYLQRQRPFSARLYSARSRKNPWSCSDQAVRQLFRASVKGPRCRYFPGSKGPALPVLGFSLSRPSTARQERLSRLRQLREKELKILNDAEEKAAEEEQTPRSETPEKRFHRIEKQLTRKATTMMSAEQDPNLEAIEEQLNVMAEAMVTAALTDAVRSFKVDTLARVLVQQALEQAAADLGLLTPRSE